MRRSQQQGEQSQDKQGQTQARSQQESQALQQLASEHENLSTFVKALQSTGLADAVARGEYTAFAPTNDAFEKMGKSVDDMLKPDNQEQLVALLRNHLVADRVDAQQAKQLNQALTVGGETLQLAQSDGQLTVNGAPVEETDIRAGSLTVHTIDQVLEPGQGAGQPSVAGQQRGQQQDRMGDQQPQGTSDEAVAGEKEEPQD
ncbi:MAG TPA: fasciclin domain-containing protein [Steroidobacteraceae bacterium]|nr:fasciclin domain-containing protein [Steroidobacteraceae bacterium]